MAKKELCNTCGRLEGREITIPGEMFYPEGKIACHSLFVLSA
jgi:hypothetical protein